MTILPKKWEFKVKTYFFLLGFLEGFSQIVHNQVRFVYWNGSSEENRLFLLIFDFTQIHYNHFKHK